MDIQYATSEVSTCAIHSSLFFDKLVRILIQEMATSTLAICFKMIVKEIGGLGYVTSRPSANVLSRGC